MKNTTSRYTDDLKYTDENGNEIYGRREPFKLKKGDSVIKQPINSDESLLDLAFKVYGESRYWWAIADVLGIENPFDDISDGSAEKIIPTQNTIIERLA